MDDPTRPLESKAALWPAALMVSVIVLLPFARWAGLPVLIMAVAGGVSLLRGPARWWADPRFRLLLALWACYAVPMVLASLDAVLPDKSWSTTAASLRFLLLGVFALHTLGAPEQRVRVWQWTSWVVVLWAVDALIQMLLGVNLLGMPLSPDRLNGVFGDTNIKLGPVLAALSPLVLEYARRHWPRWALAGTFTLLLAVIILVATRAAWVMFALVTLCYLYLYARRQPVRWLRAMAWIGLVTLAVGLAGYQLSSSLQQRIDRSLLLLSGDVALVDAALSQRLPIWEVATRMAMDHPVNGVGPRGFRYAYGDYAGAGDPWFNSDAGTGAAHAHQLLLEVATETGLIGLAGLAMALLLALGRWRRWSPAQRLAVLPFAIGLLAMLFPLNTHLAFYSTFWSLLFWWLVVLYCLNGRES